MPVEGIREYEEKYSHNHLLFLHDFSVPFDDNISERDMRKAKNRQKMAGGFRKGGGQEMYCSIMTIIETLKKRNLGMIENIRKLFMGRGSRLIPISSDFREK